MFLKYTLMHNIYDEEYMQIFNKDRFSGCLNFKPVMLGLEFDCI